jgi:hypothetical protein
MIIQAKFNSVCPLCNQTINAGSKVEWKQGQKAVHEQCHHDQLEQQKAEIDAKQAAKIIRYDDRIEVLTDLYHHGLFGNLEPELMAPKGIKAKVYSEEIINRRINGKVYECVQCQEIVRKGKEPKTKSGFFIAPLELINITKKAK